MVLYEGPFLKITYEEDKSLFVQQWSHVLNTVTDFKSEMLIFVKMYKKYCPKYVLWLQEAFSLILDKETYLWIDENVNKVGEAYGNEKVAFVVGKDVFAHVSVLDSFEDTNCKLLTRHFLSEADARDWLFQIIQPISNNLKPRVIFLGCDHQGDFTFKIENTENHVAEALKLFKSTVEEYQFTNQNLCRFTELTNREKEVLKLVAEGKTNETIGKMLFISAHTARTHWRNIKEKLNIKHEKDIEFYYKILEVDTQTSASS